MNALTLTLTFDFSSPNIFQNSKNIFSHLLVLFLLIILYTHLLKILIRLKLTESTLSIKVYCALCGFDPISSLYLISDF